MGRLQKRIIGACRPHDKDENALPEVDVGLHDVVDVNDLLQPHVTRGACETARGAPGYKAGPNGL